MRSVLNKPMMLSIRPLSKASPTVPTEGVMPSRAKCSVNRIEVYWLPVGVDDELGGPAGVRH
jgi:hypothetical protein